MDLGRASTARKRLVVLSMIAIAFSLVVRFDLNVKAQPSSEYQSYVHNYSDSTYMEKPMFPVVFNASQVLVGQNWSIVCPLSANRSYHIYLYGEWVNNGSQPETDYDIYVYNPNGTLEGYHTESAGLPEHLGDTVEVPYFTPKFSGNYTFIITNDASESMGAQRATFMVIENIECNIWQEHYVEGKNASLPTFNTSWAYEFVADSQHVEVLIKVPETLDMYEARLYLMANPALMNGTILNNVPLAWEPGLYGNMTGVNATLGGYNLESEGYRGVAYASCEYPGKDMLLNFTSPHPGKSLYHLVFIGESGQGKIDYLVKTAFDARLEPSIIPGRVYLDTNATIAYISRSTDLVNATLRYSTDDWRSSTTIPMSILVHRTCRTVIPSQPAGVFVSFRVEAFDVLDNVLVATGNYSVRQASITFVEKPMFPVLFTEDQIEVGRDWSVVCPLRADRLYHVYFYGDWVNSGSEPRTDYDVYVYNPSGLLEGYHTESAGLLEHLGSTVDAPFFVPKYSGNYTFIIANNAATSAGAQQATFMIVEDVECNSWHEHYVEGNGSSGSPLYNTSWAYEFVTDSQHVEVLVKVPETLDMYEARLYLMADLTAQSGIVLNDVPLAWEPGLYGRRNGLIGGYNLRSDGYRGVAYASCEYFGKDMLLNFTSPHQGKSLYQLVLIGEKGNGTIIFLIKTIFDACLQPSTIPGKVYLDSNATITYVSKSTDLLNATLRYSTDGWRNVTSITMEILAKRTCSTTIPSQAAGAFVSFRVEAFDVLDNVLVATGNYSVRQASITFVEKPMFPVLFTEDQIEVGRDWSVVCPLRANHSYHIYLYGDWVNSGPEPKTDYDIYVYNPNGVLEGYHTESAGLPEHLGDTINAPFFTAMHSGNYTFIIVNDAGESMSAEKATFMIIENAECNIWHEHHVEGKDNLDRPVFNTSWTYEFSTESQHIEVLVRVPETLDIYEARLYLMANSAIKNETVLSGVPLAWEPGLYGARTGTSGVLGGCNLESEGYRGVAYASCEHFGQNMLLNVTSPHAGKSLYHLVFIGESGAGEIEFCVRTVFDACLQPSIIPGKVYPNNEVVIAYVSKSTDLLNATLSYSTDGWTSITAVDMEISNSRICTATIPRQVAGASISYRVEAYDSLENALIGNGSYLVIHNAAYLERPMLPVFFTDGQIEIGRNWSIVCPLRANHTYHVYFYGEWINNGSQPKTNYDVYVTDPYDNPAGNHTASAGLLEHLGDTVDAPFFTPKYSGNYTFTIVNDAGESMSAQKATFMIIENVQCNTWHEHSVEGQDGNGSPQPSTSWAYEFIIDSQHVEVLVEVPETLDMYEARLYLMADDSLKNGTMLNDVPLAWEPGLYGNLSSINGTLGGYNLRSEGYRGVAYASCEHFGQNMLLNFTSSRPGKSLYHLVLMGEKGSGTIEFAVKTVFDASLQPSIVPGKPSPDTNATIAYVSKSTDLLSATVRYSTDDGRNFTALGMEIIDNRTCKAVIPRQNAGTQVLYGIEAYDVLRDLLVANGSYSVKNPSKLNVTLAQKTITLGENITVKGHLTPADSDMLTTVFFDLGNESMSIITRTAEDGSFVASFKPEAVGIWTVQAVFFEDSSTYGSSSLELVIEVQEPSFLAQYSLYIGIGAGGAAAAAAGVMVYLRKWRTREVEEEW